MEEDNDYYKLCIQLGLWLCQKICVGRAVDVPEGKICLEQEFLLALPVRQTSACLPWQKLCQREFLLCWSPRSCITHL